MGIYQYGYLYVVEVQVPGKRRQPTSTEVWACATNGSDVRQWSCQSHLAALNHLGSEGWLINSGVQSPTPQWAHEAILGQLQTAHVEGQSTHYFMYRQVPEVSQ